MKKILAMVLVLTLVLSMGALAFAVEGQPSKKYEDSSIVPINKELTIANPGTLNPEETFNFTIGSGSVTEGNAASAPSFDSSNFTITVAKDETSGTTNINLPVFEQVGVYTYPIEEVEGRTAGMRYLGGTNYLKITVINDLDNPGEFLRVLTIAGANNKKIDAFENEYLAGNLTVKKVIAGNYSDPDDEFEITVTVTPIDDKVINADAIEWGNGTVTGPNSDKGYEAVYTLKGGEDFTIQNLPYDVTYKVEEMDSGVGYVATYENEEGEFNLPTIETTITNTRTTNIETGINLDNLPYVLILVGAAAGLVAFTMKRRPSSDE